MAEQCIRVRALVASQAAKQKKIASTKLYAATARRNRTRAGRRIATIGRSYMAERQSAKDLTLCWWVEVTELVQPANR
jgi:hypothetical protein